MTTIKKAPRQGYVVVRTTYVYARSPEAAIRTAKHSSVADSVAAGPCSMELYEDIEMLCTSNICPFVPVLPESNRS